MKYKTINKCRICGNTNLVTVFNLGNLALTGVFPKTVDEEVQRGPLELVKCHPYFADDGCCHLLQLKHSFEKEEMYGFNYGYRSGLNVSMINHLEDIVRTAFQYTPVCGGESVIDIGSNDGTLLNIIERYLKDRDCPDTNLIGVDPTGEKFRRYYSPNVNLVSDFFSKEVIMGRYGNIKTKLITSIAMFYDLENPLKFAKDVYDILDDKGVWVMEQSYMPIMIKNNAYDTICHEHLEYYGLSQIKWIADQVGFNIVDVEFNDTNGGSFLVVLSKDKNVDEYHELYDILYREDELSEIDYYKRFYATVLQHTFKLSNLINKLNAEGKIVIGYGASTKGNVLLQLCRFNKNDIPCIIEINEDKFGCYTPGTSIPIVSENDMNKVFGTPNYMLILPWHFKKNIMMKEKEYLKNGGKLIFPLPEIETIGG